MNKINIQKSRIHNLNLYGDYFHPAYTNNFVLVCVPLKFNLDKFIKESFKTIEKLNIADNQLNEYLEAMIFLKFDHDDKLLELIEKRKYYIGINQNLRAINHTFKLLEKLNEYLGKTNELSIVNHLNLKNPGILKLFTNIHPYTKKVLRINIFLPFDRVEDCFEVIIKKISTDIYFMKFLHKVEIAKDFKLDKKDIKFPTVILYFSPLLNLKENTLIFEKLLTSLSSILDNYLNVNNTKLIVNYAYVLNSNSTISQGFRLYKVYLKYLELLDLVYDKNTNYAFLKSNSLKETNFLNLINKKAK